MLKTLEHRGRDDEGVGNGKRGVLDHAPTFFYELASFFQTAIHPASPCVSDTG